MLGAEGTRCEVSAQPAPRSPPLSSVRTAITIPFRCFRFLGLVEQSGPHWGPCANRERLCHSSGGCGPDAQGWAGPSSVGGLSEKGPSSSCPASRGPRLPSVWGSAPPQPAPPPVHGCVPSLCVCPGPRPPLLPRTAGPPGQGPAWLRTASSELGDTCRDFVSK